VPHGLANALLLSHILVFNLPACENELARIAVAMSEVEKSQAAVDAVRHLNAEVGIPARVSDVGVTNTSFRTWRRMPLKVGTCR
jgi:alcohol dehydrogenase class IV